MPFTIFAQPDEALLKQGALAPNFSGTDQFGKSFELYEALESGPILVVFYRGEWCGYCNRYLTEIMNLKAEFDKRNIRLVGISPETPDNREKTIEKNSIDFPIIQDVDMKISDRYGLTFELDAKTLTKYEGYGINLKAANGNDLNSLPVPATYFISREGLIQYVHYDPNYSKRANLNEVLRIADERP